MYRVECLIALQRDSLNICGPPYFQSMTNSSECVFPDIAFPSIFPLNVSLSRPGSAPVCYELTLDRWGEETEERAEKEQQLLSNLRRLLMKMVAN